MRAIAREKLGYYPLAPKEAERIRKFLVCDSNGSPVSVLDPCAGWTWNRHGHYDSHIPEVFPYVTFSTEVARAS